MAHAVYPGTFDPFTAGHADIVDRARKLFESLTVLVAINPDKQPTATRDQRLAAIRAQLPEAWTNVTVTTWAGLTADFCRQHHADVIIRGVRTQSDVRHESKLAATNHDLGVPTLLMPARPALAATSSTASRTLSQTGGSAH